MKMLSPTLYATIAISIALSGAAPAIAAPLSKANAPALSSDLIQIESRGSRFQGQPLALGQLFDRRFRRVLLLGGVMSLGVVAFWPRAARSGSGVSVPSTRTWRPLARYWLVVSACSLPDGCYYRRRYE